MNSKTPIVTSPLYKSLQKAMEWNNFEASNKGEIRRMGSFYVVYCYETPVRSRKAEPCMGCMKMEMKLRMVGGQPAYCKECFKMYREYKTMEEIRAANDFYRKREAWAKENGYA